LRTSIVASALEFTTVCLFALNQRPPVNRQPFRDAARRHPAAVSISGVTMVE
jgi:hypothetical protein